MTNSNHEDKMSQVLAALKAHDETVREFILGEWDRHTQETARILVGVDDVKSSVALIGKHAENLIELKHISTSLSLIVERLIAPATNQDKMDGKSVRLLILGFGIIMMAVIGIFVIREAGLAPNSIKANTQMGTFSIEPGSDASYDAHKKNSAL